MINVSIQPISWPLVTIGMPVYNSAWSLAKVLDAIVNLDYPKNQLRIVFVDNGSKDDSSNILNNFRLRHEGEYEQIQIQEFSPPSISVARNIIIDLANGTDYVFFVDADIVIPDQTLKKLIKDFGMGKDIGMTAVPCDYENASRRAGLLYRAFVRPVGCVEAAKVGAGCTLISSRALGATGKFNVKLRVHEDAEYCFRLRRSGLKILCDLTFRAYHLRQINSNANYYVKFVLQSSATYVQMLKLRSGLHYAKVASSLCVSLSLILLILFPRSILLDLSILLVSLVFASWSNLNRSAMDDGSSVKKSYWPIMGVILTALVTIVVWIALARLAANKV